MKNNKLSNSEVAAFFEQLSILLPAGIAPYEAIKLMLQDSNSESEKVILTTIVESLQDGSSFYEALMKTDVFPSYSTDMIRLGEESGTLDIINKKLSEYYKQQCIIFESFKNAITYPAIMIVLILVILLVLLTKVLPIFNQFFQQLGTSLTGVAARLMYIGTFIQSISGILLIILAVISVIALFLLTVPAGKRKLSHILQTGKLTRNLYLYIAYSRFAGALSIATAAGVNLIKSIELAKALVNNELLSPKIDICIEEVESGNYLHEAIKKAGIFHATQLRMLQIGQRSGNIDTVLSNISDYYEDRALKKIQKIVGAIEPTLVIFFSLLVGLILLSVMLPLIGIMSGLG